MLATETIAATDAALDPMTLKHMGIIESEAQRLDRLVRNSLEIIQLGNLERLPGKSFFVVPKSSAPRSTAWRESGGYSTTTFTWMCRQRWLA